MSEIILFASGKGGTGKTMFVANMGILLAGRGYKTVLLDLDMGLRNLDLYMGLENNIVYNIMDVLSGICRVSKALIKDTRYEDLYIMAASPGIDDRDITPLHVEILCEKLKKEFDYILIDAPAGMSEGFINSAVAADKAIVLTEAEYASVRNAETVDEYLAKMGIYKRAYIVNKVHADLMAKGYVPDFEIISEKMKTRMIGAMQYDDNIYISTNMGIPIVMKKDTYIYRNFNNILDRIMV